MNVNKGSEMNENKNPNDVISQAEAELSHFEAGGGLGQFELPAELSVGLSQLSRDLEKRQQAGELSDMENQMMSRINKIMERISSVATRKPDSDTPAAPAPGKNIYDLTQSQVLKQSPKKQPVVLEQISTKQAEDIIAGIDQQFQEKVVKTMDRPIEPVRGVSKVKTISEIEAERSGEGKQPDGGVNLDDYLSQFRDQRPDKPFADQDSQYDLAKAANQDSREK